MIDIDRLDHFVVPCSDVDRIADFYVRVLGMRKEPNPDGKRASLHFGRQKINLHPAGRVDVMRAPNHLAGTADFCLVSTTPIAEVAAHLRACGVELVREPVERDGALGPMMSVYFRDPDGNLVEISNYG